jgi:predicted CoA-substrate-specific enzyme activase
VSTVGVNIGASTVKVVALDGKRILARVIGHQGRPLVVLDDALTREEFRGATHVGVSGYLGHISEVAAIQRALDELDGDFDAVASLGSESFLVYMLDGRRVLTVLSHNKCAAGSGEFLVQQIGRLGLQLSEACRRSFGGKVVPLASRCSVHCKSDITHKLNRQEACVDDILRTLHDSMAGKILSLLEKGQRDLRRVLLIGGVAQNEAVVTALRAKLSATEFVVLPESPYLEAFGTALLTRDEPLYEHPRLSGKPTLQCLPPLDSYRDRVRVIPEGPLQADPHRPLVLGVDAGSTTTKAVLLDPETLRVVASHYGRTHGDPVGATRACLHALAEQVGNHEIALVATTGSAREIVAAFTNTEHVYNEISAHAAGAAHLDPTVDTIFEIGGQDSKYVHLRNGVPIDYAMNAACSAGTGSFLEESAQNDLGVPVNEIAGIALTAESPVRFKATCAAFINSDIRIALQEGCSREDIVGGLVYSIAGNYLTKVKGPRHVGSKVFLQGGVARNLALGHAFAHGVDREIVIPPSPELIGAQGVALLALRRSAGASEAVSDLKSLSASSMKLLGRFTCKACELYCEIDRLEVAGRRFPFGGRCSLFESVWKRKSRTAAVPDLVERRAEILFGGATTQGERPGRARIGIPKALTTHSLFPLYSTFFAGVGMQVILSDVDPAGELKSQSGFCFPAQIAHGAVLDLARKGVDRVFVPHVVRMPCGEGKDSYLCPITQAGPYFLGKAFPDVRFITTEIDFSEGYDASDALVDLAAREFGIPEARAREAYRAAVDAQLEAERAMRAMGRRALQKAVAQGEPAIILVGRSYNAFSPQASQSVGKKLASMGVTAVPCDCLEPATPGPTPWKFANMILNAASLAKRHSNLFLLYVSNFSCTLDSFTQAQLCSELGSKPYLMLEIDSHTADAGVQTRLEAFLDIIRNYRENRAEARSARSFTPSRLGPGGLVITSSGEKLPLSDPRVKLFFPAFSDYHSEALTMAAAWLDLHVGGVLRLSRRQLDRGLQLTSGRECLPLPISIGQLLEAHEQCRPGEIAGFYMVRGGAPCVVDSYLGYFERFIAEQQWHDVFVVNPSDENDYCGFGPRVLARNLSPAVIAADILVEIEQSLRVAAGVSGVEQLRRHWERLVEQSTSLRAFHDKLPAFIDRLAGIPLSRDPAACPRVVVTGDFFTRFSPFFMEGVCERYAEQGIILKPVDLNELVLYTLYDDLATTARSWGLKPGAAALARACSRIFRPDGRKHLARWLSYRKASGLEQRYRWEFERTGLLVAAASDIAFMFERASQHLSPAIFGEAIPAVGKGLEAEGEGYDGIILIGPFNCLPYRISEAILKPYCIRKGMPILSYESDGYPVSPAFLREADVHIRQVLEHARVKDFEDTRVGLVGRRGSEAGTTALP